MTSEVKAVASAGAHSSHSSAGSTDHGVFVCLYVVAFMCFALIWQTFHDIGLSTLLTFSVLIQCVALSSLLLSIITRRSVAGVSGKCIQLQGLSFFLRLCSTCWLKGYIPVDSTGDWLYQLSDVVALVLCGQIAYCIYKKFAGTYQAEYDLWQVGHTVLVCAVLAVAIHPDLNNRPVFDSIWTASLYIDVVSMLPQLYLINKAGNKLDALCAHYVALISFSRLVDTIFWYHGYEELAPENGGFNLAGWTVAGAHILHFFLMADFLYLYLSAMFRGRIDEKTNTLDLGPVEMLV